MSEEELRGEIERLKTEWRNMFEDRKMDLQTIRIQKKIIVELADALENHNGDHLQDSLIQRAREAANE